MEPLISVIVPVYNVRAYLEECVESLRKQTWKNTEILLIDDGSADGSGKLCDQLCRKDPRIRVIHQENQGVSCARNAGLAAATGSRIAFVDPDDWTAPEFLRVLSDAIDETGADAACCSYRKAEEDGDGRIRFTEGFPKNDDRSGAGAFLLFLQEPWYTTSVWNKLFRREALLTEDGFLPFTEGRTVGEDEKWLLSLFMNRPLRCCFLSAPLYFWRMRTGSALHGKGSAGHPVSRHMLDEIMTKEETAGVLAEAEESCREEEEKAFLRAARLEAEKSLYRKAMSLAKKAFAEERSDLGAYFWSLIFPNRKGGRAGSPGMKETARDLYWEQKIRRWIARNPVKAGILTIVSDNYGNRLQNYALQSLLSSMGMKTDVFPRTARPSGGNVRRKVMSHLKNNRWSLFYRFRDRIRWSPFTVNNETDTDVYKAISESYDRIVIGSDQIWNVTFDFIGECDFLPALPREKKAAYAASFGISTVPDAWRQKAAEWLKEISSISVREESGRKIVKDLTGRDVPCVLDPVLMVSRTAWSRMEKRPRFLKSDRYLLSYFLGERSSRNEILSYARKENLEILDISGPDAAAGPEEFLYLISHAALVCTDSFHASAFSLLFSRPLVIFERKSGDQDMSSRIDSFCSLFRLSGRRRSDERFDEEKALSDDYREAHMILDEWRAYSRNYLFSVIFDL